MAACLFDDDLAENLQCQHAMAVLEELIVWQLADELRTEVLRLTELPTARKDFRFRDQIRNAASSVPANIAEGYGRQRHAEFARFLDFATGSLRETENWLRDGVRRRIWTDDDISAARRLCKRLTPALNNLRRLPAINSNPKVAPHLSHLSHRRTRAPEHLST